MLRDGGWQRRVVEKSETKTKTPEKKKNEKLTELDTRIIYYILNVTH